MTPIFRFWIQTFSKLWIHISTYNHTISKSASSKPNNLLFPRKNDLLSPLTHSVLGWKVAFSTGTLKLETWESFRVAYLPCPHIQLTLSKWLLDESPQTFEKKMRKKQNFCPLTTPGIGLDHCSLLLRVRCC